MIRETCIGLSPASSNESLPGKEQREEEEEDEAALQLRRRREIDWKEKTSPTTSDDEREIEISGSKDAAAEEQPSSKVRRLKSATLERVGKMLKINSKSSAEKTESSGIGEDVTRKQKFNSLSRMLKFMDKEDKSKSLGQYRGRSLTRILRRKAPTEGDNLADKPDENVRGIFARLLGQIRGRASKTDTSAENSSRSDKETVAKSPSSLGLSELTLETSLCPVVSAGNQD